jgi:hypothetical protein
MKLIYSPNLKHGPCLHSYRKPIGQAHLQLCRNLLLCSRLFKHTSRSGAHCTIVFQRRLIIETTFLVQQSTFIACTFILFWQFVFVCYTMHSVVNSKENSPSKVFLWRFVLGDQEVIVCLFVCFCGLLHRKIMSVLVRI